ncbi:MAG: amidohydrolase family protein, partial [Rhodobacterales bacterium]|nr:amidohydrolase family protein [Rhodobacterales bacterium]
PGYVVLVDGLIEAVGEGAAPEVAGAKVYDITGQFVTPGIIDTHSHLGVYPSPGAKAHSDGNEATAPTTPGVWAEHSFWPQDPGLSRAIAGGGTALQILPGSANLVGGRGVVLQVVPARGSRAMRFPGAAETVKMACGENPKRVYGDKGGPSTRMGNIHGQREVFFQAEAYLKTWEKYDAEITAFNEAGSQERGAQAKAPEPPDRDLNKETLALVLTGDVLPQIHCYRADDMLSMLQISHEFGFQIRSFHHALEAYKIRDILAEEDVASSTWADWWGFKLEAYDGIPENAAMLTQAGARAIIHSDSGIGIQRLNQEAAKAYYAGLNAGIELTEDQALKWLTLNPAWALGIDGQTGSLEVGKRADVVVWDAHPFSVRSRAHWVFVDGQLRWDSDRPQLWSDFEIGQEVTP